MLYTQFISFRWLFKEFGSRANAGRVTFESNSNKQEMYGGASSRPMAWSGGGSTQVSKLRIEVCSFNQDDTVIFLYFSQIWFTDLVEIFDFDII